MCRMFGLATFRTLLQSVESLKALDASPQLTSLATHLDFIRMHSNWASHAAFDNTNKPVSGFSIEDSTAVACRYVIAALPLHQEVLALHASKPDAQEQVGAVGSGGHVAWLCYAGGPRGCDHRHNSTRLHQLLRQRVPGAFPKKLA